MKRRGKGEGSLRYNEKKKLWIGRIPIGLYENGTTKYKTLQHKQKSKLLELMAAAKKDNEDYSPKSSTPFEDYILYWFQKQKVDTGSIKNTSLDILRTTINSNVIPYIGHYPLKDITYQIIQTEVINALAGVKALNSIKKAKTAIKACLNFAVEENLIPRNPCEGRKFVMPQEIKEGIRFFSSEELCVFSNTAVSVLPDRAQYFQNGEILVFCMHTGLRCGELLGLKKKHFVLYGDSPYIIIQDNVVSYKDESGKTIVEDLPSTKTNCVRYVPLNQTALQIAKERIRRCENRDDYFSTMSKNMMAPSSLYKKFRRICKVANINNPHGVHTLRHTFATQLFLQGVQLNVVSQLLGHSDIEVTANYYVEVTRRHKMDSVLPLDDIQSQEYASFRLLRQQEEFSKQVCLQPTTILNDQVIDVTPIQVEESSPVVVQEGTTNEQMLTMLFKLGHKPEDIQNEIPTIDMVSIYKGYCAFLEQNR